MASQSLRRRRRREAVRKAGHWGGWLSQEMASAPPSRARPRLQRTCCPGGVRLWRGRALSGPGPGGEPGVPYIWARSLGACGEAARGGPVDGDSSQAPQMKEASWELTP